MQLKLNTITCIHILPERDPLHSPKMPSLCQIFLSVFVGLAAVVLFVLHKFMNHNPTVPEFPRDGWWGYGEPESDGDLSVKEFRINISDDVLKDLQQRLANFRFGEDLENTDFNYGFRTVYMREIADYWKTQYNWRQQEAKLNKYQHYKTKIEGIEVHFLRSRSSHKSTSTSIT